MAFIDVCLFHAGSPFARLDSILLLVKNHLRGKIPEMLKEKDNQVFLDFLAKGCCLMTPMHSGGYAGAPSAEGLCTPLHLENDVAGPGTLPNTQQQQQQQQQAVVVRGSGRSGQGALMESCRDPLIRGLDQYLCVTMKDADYTKDEEGVYLFNINKVAYLVEGSKTKDEKKMTRQRVEKALPSISLCPERTAGNNSGKCLTVNPKVENALSELGKHAKSV
jgi:hypothetical protein